jgi:hypothetical protein
MYDIQRDVTRMNARMQKTAAFAATLLGETFDEADRRAREHGYELQRIIPGNPVSADLSAYRIRCRLDDQDLIVDTAVG